MVITDESREKIKKYLPRDYRKIISEKLSVSKQTVYNVLYKSHDNFMVVEAIIELAKEHSNKIKSYQKNIDNL